MIYILDDTISQRKGSILYLKEEPYLDICKIIEFPTNSDNRTILETFSKDGDHMLCIHRSLMYFNDSKETLSNSETIRRNFISQVTKMNINSVVFGRDMNNNRELLFIDKDRFYSNLKFFLDQWIDNNEEIDILYEGAMYKIATRKKLLDRIITIINDGGLQYNNTELKDCLKEYLPEEDPESLISRWVNQNMTKKYIRMFINEKL